MILTLFVSLKMLHLHYNNENTENMINLFFFFYHLPTLNFVQVGERINLKDYDAIKKWLISKDITIHKMGKPYVYEIDVDCAIDKVKVMELKKQYPNDWIELYRKISKDESVCEMVIHSLSGEETSKPTTKIKLSNNIENELYKKYSK